MKSATLVSLLLVAPAACFVRPPLRTAVRPSQLRSSSGEDAAIVAADKELAIVVTGGLTPFQSTTSLARRGAVEALTAALTRLLDRSTEATGMMSSELETIAQMLDLELAADKARMDSVEQLIKKLVEVVNSKAIFIRDETILLTKIQEIKQSSKERVIQARMEEAANAKAELISIEMVLSETMEVAKEQLMIELKVVADRISRVNFVRAGLPLMGDVGAVRAYGYQELVDLQDTVAKAQAAIKETDVKVMSLRQRIATSLDQRSALLGTQTAAALQAEMQAGEEARKVAAKREAQATAEGDGRTKFGSVRSSAPAPATKLVTKPAGVAQSIGGLNEVQLFQRGAASAGIAFMSLGKALVKTVSGEEGVGDALRATGNSATAAANDLRAAADKISEK
jgi:hypothetical protein